MRKIRVVVLAVAIGVAVAACGGGAKDSGGKAADAGGELVFANWQWLEPSRGEQIWSAVSGYQQANAKATLKKQEITRKDFENTMKTQMGGGGGPDVLVIPDSFFPELAKAKLLEPVDGVVPGGNKPALNKTNEAGKWEGKQLAFSWEVVNYAFFWNSAILAKAGVTAPTTPEELVTAATTIKQKTGVTGFAVRHQMNEETVWWTDFANWPYGFGGGWSKDGKLTIDSPQNIDAVKAYKKVYDSGAFAKGDDASTFRSKFKEGKIAMMIDNSSALFTMVNGNATVPSPSVKASKLPFPTAGSSQVGVYIGINKNSKNKALARDFLKWMFTETAQKPLANALGGASTIGTDTSADAKFTSDNPWVPAFRAQATSSRPAVVAGFEVKTPQIRKTILTQLERVLTQNVDPAVALKQAQKDAEAAVA